jgi:hypothetical protein
VNLIINKRAGGPPASRSEDLPDSPFGEEAEGFKVLLDILGLLQIVWVKNSPKMSNIPLF